MNKPAPAVSLVIPVYNAEKYLAEAMRSVCAQTLGDLEVICVDDCSTDNSLNILRDFSAYDSRIRIITRAENGGPATARKFGISASRGQFLMFMDSDDLLLPHTCERALELIRQNQCDILQFNIQLLNGDVLSGPDEIFIPYNGRIEKSPLIDPWLAEEKFVHTLWGKIFRGDICRQAAKEMVDHIFSCALDDYYTFFVISFLSSSYCGIPDESLYIYRKDVGMGAGVTTTLRSADLLPLFKDFLDRKSISEERQKLMLSFIENRLYKSSLGILLRTKKLEPSMLKEAERAWGAQILYDFIVYIGVLNVETDNWIDILPRLADILKQQQSDLKN